MQAMLTVLPPELETTFLLCQAEAKRAWHPFSYTLKLSAPSSDEILCQCFTLLLTFFFLSPFGLLILYFLILLGRLAYLCTPGNRKRKHFAMHAPNSCIAVFQLPASHIWTSWMKATSDWLNKQFDRSLCKQNTDLYRLQRQGRFLFQRYLSGSILHFLNLMKNRTFYYLDYYHLCSMDCWWINC